MKSFILIFVFSIFITLTGCNKNNNQSKQSNTSMSSTQAEKEKNQKIELVQEITGVWANNQNLMSIVYQNGNFQFWHGNTQMIAKLGDIDLKNETVNILFSIQKNAPELILTVKRVWNADKTSFTLEVTGEQSIAGEFKFIRKITNDDLNRFAQIAQHQANTKTEEMPIAPKNNNDQPVPVEPVPSTTVIYPASVTLSTTEAHKIARSYINQMFNYSAAETLRPYYAAYVDYYDKGTISQDRVIGDKENYINKWHTRQAYQDGALKISNGITDNQKVVTFTYRFVLTDHEKEIRGKSIRHITFEKMGNEIVIISEKGKPLGSSVRRLR